MRKIFIQALKSGVAFRYTDFEETLKCLTALLGNLLYRLFTHIRPEIWKVLVENYLRPEVQYDCH